MMSGGQEQKIEETVKEREPGVYVFLPEESDPFVDFDVDPVCQTQFVVKQISEDHKFKGYLSKRGKTKRVGTETLPAGNYDFHVTERVSQPQPQGK